MAEYDVIIIGAGFAGLSAGVALTRAGARVLVLEARSRLGGRATAITDRETGEPVDNGQHVFLGCYTETLAFLDAIGARDHLRAQPALSVTMIDRKGQRTSLSCPTLPAPLHLLAGVMEWDALRWADRLAVLKMATPIKLARQQFLGRNGHRGRISASPGETVENWLLRNGQTPRLIEMLWEPLAVAALNQSPSTAAAPPFARVLAEMFSGDPRAAAILLPAKPLSEMYAEPARRYIERGAGEVRTGTPAMVRVKGDCVDEVVCGNATWRPSRVIVAVPWFACADLFAGDLDGLEPVLERSRAMAPSPIVTVNLWFARSEVPSLDAPFVGLPGRAMQWVFDKRVIFGDGASHLSLVSSGASALVEKSNAEIIKIARQELSDVIPAARSKTMGRATVVREPRATFSLAPGEPARPSTVTPIRGLYLAGDWIDTGLPATIESAVRSGHLAARAAWGASR